MHSHVHQAELSVILNLFLAIESHGIVCSHSGSVYKVTGLNEHTTRSTSTVKKDTACRLQHINDHLNQWLRREGNILCKFIQEVLIDAAHDITTDLIKSVIIEDAKQLTKELIGEHGIVLRQNANKLLALSLNQLHCIIYNFTKAVQRLSISSD